MSLFRGTAEAALHCAHRTSTASTMLLPRLHRLSQKGGLFGLPLRASNEHLPSVRVARAQEANRPPSHSSLDRDTPLLAMIPPLDSTLLLRTYCLQPPLFKGVGV
jgi:hypothetical protein